MGEKPGVDEVRVHGQSYRRDFGRVMTLMGFGGWEGMLEAGVACVDVQNGPEVVAFGEDVPNGKMYVAESKGIPGEVRVLEELQREFGFRWSDERPEIAVQSWVMEGVGGLGLVTWTNVFPEGGGEEMVRRVREFLVWSGALLMTGGMVVVSAHKGRDDGNIDWMDVFEQVVNQQMEGMDLGCWDTGRRGVAGEYYLVGVALEEEFDDEEG